LTLTSREKKTLAIGAVIAGVVVLIAYVLVPAGSAWVQLGRVLGPKLQYVERLQERAEEQNALVARRDVLVARLGSVLGPEAAAPVQAREERSEKQQTRTPGSADAERSSDAKPAEPPLGEPSSKPEGSRKLEAGPETPDTFEDTLQEKPEDKSSTEEKESPKPTARPSGISFATHLERIAKKSGVKVNKVTPTKPAAYWKGNGYFKPVGLVVGFEANIQSLIKFLQALEKGERLVRLEQAQFRRDPARGQKITVTLNLVGYESVE
jgi:hypothetical protein